MNLLKQQQLEAFHAYEIGDTDARSWGGYEVLNVGTKDGETFCEKRIGVKPYQALSLQRHHGRREYWEVLSGEITILHNGVISILKEGESVDIAISDVHSMINLTDKPVVVFERQLGACKEDDNDRLCDYAGRKTVEIAEDDLIALKSKAVYLKMTDSLHAMRNNSKDKAA